MDWMVEQTNQTGLRLEPIAGPPMDRVALDPPGPYRVGRGTDSDIVLPYGTVSRRHGLFALQAGQWLLLDRGSRHGTFINGVRLEAGEPTPIHSGDLIRIGPWTFRVRDPASQGSSVSTTNDFHASGHRIETVQKADRLEFAQQRLDLLIEWAGSAHAAGSLEELARRMLQTALEGTGFSRGAVVRQVSASGEVETLADVGHGVEGESRIDISRSLLAAASAGEVVRLTNEVKPTDYGESILQLGIHSAVCAPLMLERSVEAYLYLDARAGERTVASDAANFCAAVARVGEMALGNIRRAALESQRRAMEADIHAARDAQNLIMPPESGQYGRVRYAMTRRPGRFVAGDLFDVVPKRESGVLGVLLGDVSGHGVGAGLLMAIAQTNLRLGLRTDAAPGELMTDLNEYLLSRNTTNQFVTLWLGMIDPARSVVRFVDAGHGHWLVCRPGCSAERIACQGGIPVGIEPGIVYPTEDFPIEPGTRVVVFSDGLIEQVDLEGEQFGLQRAVQVLNKSTDAAHDVQSLLRAVMRHAGSDALSDDLTIASIEILPE